MDFLDLVKARKSIRKFKVSSISDDILKYILECGINSPSACNIQPYRFIVIRGRFKDKFCKEVFSGIYHFCSFVKDAFVIIAIIRNKKSFKMKIGELVTDCDFSLIDIGICGQQIVLAATEKGLGSLWIGWFDREKAKKMLKVSTDERVEILIAIGEKGEEPSERKKKTFDEVVSFIE
ncbi:MAG: nitroreductase family protein [Elusimicrobiales bacterium]|nr:nitroreductase family protein [Elusimicrobiales bacterium]